MQTTRKKQPNRKTDPEDILAFLRQFRDSNGYPPSVREIQLGLGISSTSVVDYGLAKLEKENRITRQFALARSIRLVEEPGDCVCECGDRHRKREAQI